jgi:hypothetical protein
LRSEKEVASYLLLAGKLRRQEVTLSAEQQVGWRRLSALVAPVLRTMSQLAEVARELDGNLNALRSQHDEVTAAREQACSGIACTVERVEGETRVSTLLLRLADTPLSALPGKDLKARLRRTDPADPAAVFWDRRPLCLELPPAVGLSAGAVEGGRELDGWYYASATRRAMCSSASSI